MKRFRAKRKFGSSTKKKTKEVKVPTIFAKSPITNFTHGFANPEAWDRDIAVFARIHHDRMAQDLLNSVPFWNWLNQQAPPDLSKTQKWTAPLFRVVYGGFDPLSVAGTLASGGRYNIGGAQQIPITELSQLNMQAALYAADSVDCAKAEAGNPLGAAEIFRLTTLSALTLWNIDAVIAYLSWPNLKGQVDAQPFNKIWVNQKCPTISQLLGTYLRKIGGDGIYSRSTKSDGGSIISIFLADDNQAKTMFTANRV